MPQNDDAPSLTEMGAQIAQMPDGPRKADLLKKLADLKHAQAMHDVLTDEIAEQMKDQG